MKLRIKEKITNSLSAIVLLLLVFGINTAIALDANAESRVLKACVTEWKPFSYKVDGQVVGFSIEIYNEIAKRAEFGLSYDMIPYARCKKEFELGNYDVIIDGGPGVPNSLNLNEKKRPVPWVITLWVPDDSDVDSFRGIKQFAGRTIGVTRDYYV
ncbi:MAG: transporter substrate-binding domain-containing protein, partial [Arenicella sp.]